MHLLFRQMLSLLFFLGYSYASSESHTMATKHHLFVGSYGSSSIFGVTYDEIASTLTVVKNNTTRPENEWLALAYDSKTLYSSGSSGWSQFPVQAPDATIGKEVSTTPKVAQCTAWRGVYILASRRAPYTVYGSLNCANYVGIGAGSTGGKFLSLPYNENVVIYGMAMDPSYSYLYSSDWKNGKIWTHKVNPDGSLTVVGSVDSPSPVSAPRSVVVHPGGKALYVILEAWNAVAYYTINQTTHLPVYTNGLYPLLPTSK
jgi:carboxy-cis,cis-muconate cyclase